MSGPDSGPGAQPPGLLDEAGMEALRRLGKSVAYVEGAVLLQQGRQVRGAFFLESGEVEARVALPGGGHLPVARLGAGSMLGETALLEQGICSATVVAKSGVNALFVDRDDFRAFVAQRNEAVIGLQHALALMLARKLRALNAKVLACDAPEDPRAQDEPRGDPLANVPRKGSAFFETRRFLPLLAVFREFGEDDIDRVMARARFLELPRAHRIFAAGQAVGASWIVVRGAVEISARRGAKRRRIAVLGPGEWVGVMSQLDATIRGADARARESSVLLEIGRAEFDALYGAGDATSARIQRAIHRALLQALKHTNNQLTRLISQGRIRSHRVSVPVKELQAALYGQLCHAVG